MAVGEEADGVVEGVDKVGRATEEVEVEVTGTRFYNKNPSLHLRASASPPKNISEKVSTGIKVHDG